MASRKRKKDINDDPVVRLPLVEQGYPRGRATVQDVKDILDENTRLL